MVYIVRVFSEHLGHTPLNSYLLPHWHILAHQY
jgi:hypothetical protein